MKRFFSIFLTLTLLVSLLSGCSGDGTGSVAEDHLTPVQIAAEIAASQESLPELYAVTPDSPEFEPYSMIYLGEYAAKCRDGVICYPFGVTACEIAVFLMDSAGTAESCAELIEDYRAEREGAFFGYAPEESELAGRGLALSRGDVAALVICRDPESAEKAWESCFGTDAVSERELFDYVQPMPEPGDAVTPADAETPDDTETPDSTGTPDGADTPENTGTSGDTEEPDKSDGPETPDALGEGDWADDPIFLTADPAIIDNPDNGLSDVPCEAKAVARAFETGDLSELTAKEAYVYRHCREILSEIITDGMTDVQKEWRVNYYLVMNTAYDPAELSNGPVGTPDPDNANPYGVLAHGLGICLGYTSTFELFMDILDIPCQTVRGFAFDDREDHAWNLVELDGEWYAVDVTWNDPVFTDSDGNVVVPDEMVVREYSTVYFNVTSNYLRATDHEWTADAPEAEGTRYAWDGDWEFPGW